jgi:hypothetical protein
MMHHVLSHEIQIDFDHQFFIMITRSSNCLIFLLESIKKPTLETIKTIKFLISKFIYFFRSQPSSKIISKNGISLQTKQHFQEQYKSHRKLFIACWI